MGERKPSGWGAVAALAELAVVLAGISCYLWQVRPLGLVRADLASAGLLLAALATSRWRAGATLHDEGWRRDNLASAARLVLPVTVAAVAVLWLAWSQVYPVRHDAEHLGRIGTRLPRTFLLYILWALVQQYLLLSFVRPRLEEALPGRPAVTALTAAAFFAALHVPNQPLMIFCLAGGTFWVWAFRRRPNLLVAALSHALLGVVNKHFLYVYMRVGPESEYGQWSRLLFEGRMP